MTDVALATWKHRGTLYCEDNATAESTVDATPRQIANLGAKGVEEGLTVDTANSKITAAAAGDYLISAGVSFSGTISKTFVVEIYIDTTGTNLKLERKLGTGGDVGSAHVSGIITLAVGEDVSLYQSTTDGGSAFTIQNGQLSVVRLS